MENRLHEYYPFNGADINGKLVLCLDQRSLSGEFTLVSLLLQHIQLNNTVHLLALNHNKAHYSAILRKHNIDLAGVIASKQVHFHPVIIEDISIDPTDACAVQTVAESIAQLPTKKHVIFLDDIDMLEVYLGNVQAGRQAISHLHSIVNRHQRICSLVCFGRDVTSKIPAAFTEISIQETRKLQRTNLTEYVKQRSDISIVVACLGTGYSMDIHGQVTIVNKCKQKAFTFKALDSGIQCSLLR